MTLPSLAFAALSLVSPDPCAYANEVATQIQLARNSQVPIITVLIALEASDLYQRIAVVSYSNPPMPPAIFGSTVEGVCRKALN